MTRPRNSLAGIMTLEQFESQNARWEAIREALQTRAVVWNPRLHRFMPKIPGAIQ